MNRDRRVSPCLRFSVLAVRHAFGVAFAGYAAEQLGNDGNYELPRPPAPVGTLSALMSDVTIAIPVSQERISPVLDTAARLLLITRRRGKEVARKEFVLAPSSTEAVARSVTELHVDVLLCAALSESLLRELEKRGVRVRPHLCGRVEAVLHAFCCRQLGRDEFRMPGCWGAHLHGECCHRRNSAQADERGRKETQTSTST